MMKKVFLVIEFFIWKNMLAKIYWLNQYGLSHDFVPGENVIEFTPEDVGIVDYTCWMGMISGRINVIDGE